jgi:hypothetical protein
VWIQDLRPGVPFEIVAVDAYGTPVEAAPTLALEPEETRAVEFRVVPPPRALLVVVRDSLDEPVARAALLVTSDGSPRPSSTSLFTDRAGMLRVEPLYSADVKLEVVRAGFEPRTIEHVHVPREGATVAVRLARDWWPW